MKELSNFVQKIDVFEKVVSFFAKFLVPEDYKGGL